jgi:hypothetical protein
MPYREGSALAGELTRRLPDGRCVMTSDESLDALAAEAVERGWSEVLTRPGTGRAVLLALRRARERTRLRQRAALLEDDLARAAGDRPIVAASPAMIELLEQVERIAGRHGAVLLSGEPGTGREGIARAIHAQSPRRSGPFVAIDCAHGNDRERERRLFGGARRRTRVGDARPAATLYFDAIEALPIALQLRLAAALREADAPGAVERRLRAIAATHATSTSSCAAGVLEGALRAAARRRACASPRCASGARTSRCSSTTSSRRGGRARPRQLTITGDALDLLIGYPLARQTCASSRGARARRRPRRPHDVISRARAARRPRGHAAPENPLALRPGAPRVRGRPDPARAARHRGQPHARGAPARDQPPGAALQAQGARDHRVRALRH